MVDKVAADNDIAVDYSKVARPGDARLGMMDGISRSRVQQLAADNDLNVDEVFGKYEPQPEPEPHPVAEPEPEVVDELAGDPQPTEAEEQVNRAFVDDDALATTFVKIKVNGVEQEVSLAELRTDAQKVKSATQRFEEASRLKREAEELVAKAKNNPSPTTTEEHLASGGEGEANNDQPSAVNADAVSAVIDAFYSGDEEAARAALSELLQSTGRDNTTHDAQQTVDTNTIAAEVLAQIERNTAIEEFKSKYQDVWGNEMLAAQADRILATKMDEGVPFKDALFGAGNDVRDMVKKAAEQLGMASTPQGGKTNSRVERKKGLDTVTGNGGVASTTVAEVVPQTASQTIAEMAKSRGVHRNF